VPFRDHRCFRSPSVTHTPAFLNPKKIKRKSKNKGKASNPADSRPLLRSKSPSSASASSSHSTRPNSPPANPRPGVVDLVVEDKEAEDKERARARKEGGPGFNDVEPKLFVRKYGEHAGEEIKEGFEVNGSTSKDIPAPVPDPAKIAENAAFKIGDDEDEDEVDSRKPSPLDELEVENAWKSANEERDNNKGGNEGAAKVAGAGGYSYGDMGERDVWGRDD
jgi:hypothetical protein